MILLPERPVFISVANQAVFTVRTGSRPKSVSGLDGAEVETA